MIGIAAAIREGAMAFLKREYSVLALFAGATAVVLFVANLGNGTQLVGLSFLIGAACSALAGLFGMRVATAANVRTANAARESIVPALRVAFAGGSVMGMSVVGLAILGLSGLFFLYAGLFGTTPDALQGQVLQVLSGFSLGASSIALFARVGGGIYTKSADVGGRPGGQGGSRNPRGRPPEPGGDRRQRRRQRRGCLRDGRGPLRVLRGGDHRRHGARGWPMPIPAPGEIPSAM